MKMNKFLLLLLTLLSNLSYADDLQDFSFDKQTVLLNKSILTKDNINLSFDTSKLADNKETELETNTESEKITEKNDSENTVSVTSLADVNNDNKSNSFIENFIENAIAEEPPINNVTDKSHDRVEELREHVLASSLKEDIKPVSKKTLAQQKKELRQLESQIKKSNQNLENVFPVTFNTSKVLSSSDFSKWSNH